MCSSCWPIIVIINQKVYQLIMALFLDITVYAVAEVEEEKGAGDNL